MGSLEADLFFWMVARATGVAAFVALAIAVFSGVALRTSVLDWLAKNRPMRELHELATALWLPLGAIHLIALLVDKTARIDPVDLVIPFGVSYGPLAVGLGTIAFDLFVLVTITSWMKRAIEQRTWSWIHRTSYVAFGLTFAHAILSGTDFSAPEVSALAWSLGFVVLVLAGARVVWGRLPA